MRRNIVVVAGVPPVVTDRVPVPEIVVYWRPGCGFCSGLFRQLEHHGVPHRTVEIWGDPGAAAFVRSIARGHETVPTVTVGPVGLVNPKVHDVLAVALEQAPDSVPADYEPPQPGRIARWLTNRLSG